MGYFPFLTPPGFDGFVVVHNFPPNSWEVGATGDAYVYLIWLDDQGWSAKLIWTLPFGASKKIMYSDVSHDMPRHQIALIGLSKTFLPAKSQNLPHLNFWETRIPNWRATIGISSEKGSCSYQGELDIFPPHRSVVSFSPFFQRNIKNSIKNYLIFINLESSTKANVGTLEVYRAKPYSSLLASALIHNNQVNIISLNEMDLPPDELLVFISRSMAGIPLYLSVDLSGGFMSLEHTHPPASFVIHGDRFIAQSKTKNIWLEGLKG